MKPPLVVYDLDDCLFYWSKHFVTWLFEHKLPEIDTHDTKTWFTSKHIYEFNHSDNFYNREPMPLHTVFVNNKHFTNWKVLSACGSDLKTNVMSLLGLNKWDLAHITCVDDSVSKYEHLTEWSKEYNVLMIDDKLSTINWCNENNIHAVLSTNHNQVIRRIREHFSYKVKIV